MKMIAGPTFSALLLMLVAIGLVHGNCVWYGQCGIDPGTDKPLNCHYDGPAKVLDKDHRDVLKELCPELVPATGDVQTCCDADQLEALQTNLKLPENIIEGCPACWSNFKKYLCQLVCRPDQDNFLYPQKLGPKTDKGSPILGVEYFMTNSFVDGLFNSCQNVYASMMNMYALDMMCGQWGKAECTGERWLNYLGDINNGQTPFLINMTYTNRERVEAHGQVFHPMNMPTTPCNKPVKGEHGSACSCKDCPASC